MPFDTDVSQDRDLYPLMKFSSALRNALKTPAIRFQFRSPLSPMPSTAMSARALKPRWSPRSTASSMIPTAKNATASGRLNVRGHHPLRDHGLMRPAPPSKMPLTMRWSRHRATARIGEFPIWNCIWFPWGA